MNAPAPGSDNDAGRSQSRLRVELQSHGRTCTLALFGVLSATSIAALEAQIDQLGCIPCDAVVVDVRGLRGLDPVGANVLLGLDHYVDGRGGCLWITGAVGQVAMTLRNCACEWAHGGRTLLD